MDKIIQNLLEMKLYRGPFHIDSGDSHLIPIYEETHTLKQEVDFVKPYDKWIKTKQYGANDPCEDTLEYRRLDSINAYTVSIFDGHGGP